VTCLTCKKESRNGETTFRVRQGEEIVTYDCSCIAQWRLSRWMLNSGIDLQYQHYSWDNVNTVDMMAKKIVLEYLDSSLALVEKGVGLTLWSKDVGSGKTLLVTMLLKGLIAMGHEGYFTQFNDMVNQHTAGWADQEERAWFDARIRNAGVLVIDDIGRENKGRSHIIEEMFDTVIRARDQACKPTFITTNYTPDEMKQGYGLNLLSLLSGKNIDAEVPGKDYRPIHLKQIVQDSVDGIDYPIVVS
jgi:DNA replication protein DnaC